MQQAVSHLKPSMPPADPSSRPPMDAARSERLARTYARTRDPRIREALVLHHQRLVRSIASRFASRGEALEDLLQVGNIGLIKSIDRFDPEQKTRFSTYATPTIYGEISRYFRDKTDGVQIPRWLRELYRDAQRARVLLTTELGRTPTMAEIADRLQLTEEETLEALESGLALSPLSLDQPLEAMGDGGAVSLLERVGNTDRALRDFETYSDLRAAIDSLRTLEREIITLRFYQEMSQAKIAQKLNLSQMHVSRLQRRALARLREMLARELPELSSSPLHIYGMRTRL